ncbi:MAG: class I SAM-dependent methyltransferase [Planctomycetes bacterium]|nr:class I SAM-dependent methyltransferase [Planctomycetota bacterium]
MPTAENTTEDDTEWFKAAFNDEYRLVYAGRTEDQAAREVECVVRELTISPSDRVLDLCCGHGRHLRALRKLGVGSFGVDLSLSLLKSLLLQRADEHGAQSDADHPRIVRADMRSLPFAPAFDVVVNFFTSFGYFESESEHRQTLRQIAAALKPGGRFSVDLMNPQAAISTLQPLTERTVDRLEIVERRRYDAQRRRIEKQVTLKHPDWREAKAYTESVRVFWRDEVEPLIESAGLRLEKVLGDFDGRLLTEDAPRMILLGKKPL